MLWAEGEIAGKLAIAAHIGIRLAEDEAWRIIKRARQIKEEQT